MPVPLSMLLVLEPRALCMLGECCTAELYLQPKNSLNLSLDFPHSVRLRVRKAPEPMQFGDSRFRIGWAAASP